MSRLIINLDFYFENSRRVFTAYYLKKIGKCCKSGCRHCPFGFGNPTPDPPFVQENYPPEHDSLRSST